MTTPKKKRTRKPRKTAEQKRAEQAAAAKKKTAEQLAGGNGKLSDMVLVPRGYIANAIQALTLKPEFVNPRMVGALVEEFGKILAPQMHEGSTPRSTAPADTSDN